MVPHEDRASIKRRARTFGRSEVLEWVGIAGQCRTQSRDIELGGDKITLQMFELGGVHGWVELDQNVGQPVAHVDRSLSNGWITLVRPLGIILPGAVATMSTLPKQAQTTAAKNSAIILLSAQQGGQLKYVTLAP